MDGKALEFVRDAFRHGKAMLVVGEGSRLLTAAGIPTDAAVPGLVMSDRAVPASTAKFIDAISEHRHPARETDPPVV